MFGLALTEWDWVLIGLYVEGFFYGLYSAIFAIYLQYQVPKLKNCVDKRTKFLFASLCILYVLSVAFVATDTAQVVLELLTTDDILSIRVYNTVLVSGILGGFCEFISQFILIYRCWTVWNRNIRVVIIPSILSFAFLITWLTGSGLAVYHAESTPSRIILANPVWGHLVGLASIVMTLTVHALVTGLIVFKIFKVYWEVRPLYNPTFSSTGGTKLRPIIFILLESGMVLFLTQLAVIVLQAVSTQNAIKAYQPIISIYQLLNVITPTIIQVRGLSLRDENSVVAATDVMRFESDHLNAIPETVNDNSIAHQENRYSDTTYFQRSNYVDHQENRDDDTNSIRAGDYRSNSFDVVEFQREQHISS